MPIIRPGLALSYAELEIQREAFPVVENDALLPRLHAEVSR